MKKLFVILIISLTIVSGVGTGVFHVTPLRGTRFSEAMKLGYPDQSAFSYAVSQQRDTIDHLARSSPHYEPLRTDYPLGAIIWQYQITGGYDTSPKSIVSIPDINGDGIDEVVVASDDGYVRCFNGGAIGTGQVLWETLIYAGAVYSQPGLTVTQDVNGDGIPDIVVGAAWGARLIRCLSGKDGSTIWTHDTHEYGGGGWVYQVDARYDFNGDGVRDVLACAGDDGSGTGPNRVYCLDGLTGVSLWERPLGGPGFSVIGVEDFTGDGIPDVVAGCSDAGESTGYAKGINGATGAEVWSFTTASSSVWALSQIDDVNGDGIKDVVIGDFAGHVYGLDAATGGQLYMRSLGSGVIITRLAALTDVNGDGHPNILVGHSTTTTVQVLDGQTGNVIWSHPVADQPWNVARIADISGDGIDDAVVGTLFSNNYCYFLNGVDGSELLAPIAYGQAVDAINSIPDVVGDGSMEMLVGGRDGLVTCFSGGLNASGNSERLIANFTATPRIGQAPLQVQFIDTSIAQNTTISSWKWDFDHDGVIDSQVQNPSWTYTTPGNYTVSLTISNGQLTDTETKTHFITVLPAPEFMVVISNITGRILKIQAEVTNTGAANMTKLPWNITVSGGIVLLGKIKSGTILSLPVSDTAVIADRPVFGFGKITITITVVLPGGEEVTKTVVGILFAFFIIGIH
jgi:PKD repeat protein